jgi:hypothetical protein
VAGPCGFRYRRLSVCPIQSGAKSNRSVRSRLSRSPVACCCLRARLKAKNKSTRTPESRGKEARVGISLIRNIFQCIAKNKIPFRTINHECLRLRSNSGIFESGSNIQPTAMQTHCGTMEPEGTDWWFPTSN